MKTIKSINEISGFKASVDQQQILDQVLHDTLNNINGLIKYKYYISYNPAQFINEINIVLMIKKEYELIYALNNELTKLEDAISIAFKSILRSNFKLVVIYK